MSVVDVKIVEAATTKYVVTVREVGGKVLDVQTYWSSPAFEFGLEMLQIPRKEITLALKVAEQNGDDLLHFGITGCFITSDCSMRDQ